MGPSWHEPSAQALNHDENYECRSGTDFGGQHGTLPRSRPVHSASENRWVR